MTSNSNNKDFLFCPACGKKNISGIETCEYCNSDLTYIGKEIHAVTSSSLEKGALLDPLTKIETTNVYRVFEELTTRRTLEIMHDLEISSIMIEDETGEIVGVFSDQEILKNVFCNQDPDLDQPIKNFMSKYYIRLSDDCTVIQALNLSVVNDYHVIIDTGFQKLITYRDLLNYIVDFYPSFGKIVPDK
ncbi:MAG: hypothetical protein HeimC3_44070 [Candidatus Heimdallarchaeota archaeon LC_3]|nr:MAG: hypothetical protein HeimC3_44070 [Candidatus Heimdallarchaeota archaeon LC_3]